MIVLTTVTDSTLCFYALCLFLQCSDEQPRKDALEVHRYECVSVCVSVCVCVCVHVGLVINCQGCPGDLHTKGDMLGASSQGQN